MKYRIEIQPPDIKPYRKGNAGVDYVHVLDSGKPGPERHGAGADARQRVVRRLSPSTFCSERKYAGEGQAGPGVRQRRRLRALRLRRSRPLALYRRGLQPRLGGRGDPRQARLGRAAPRARAAAVRRRRRLPARPALDARALPADHGVRHARQGCRACAPRRRAGRPADRHRPPRRACACATAAASATRRARRTRCSSSAASTGKRARSTSRSIPRCASSRPPGSWTMPGSTPG